MSMAVVTAPVVITGSPWSAAVSPECMGKRKTMYPSHWNLESQPVESFAGPPENAVAPVPRLIKQKTVPSFGSMPSFVSMPSMPWTRTASAPTPSPLPQGDQALVPICALCGAKLGIRHMQVRHVCHVCNRVLCASCCPNWVQFAADAKPEKTCKECVISTPRRRDTLRRITRKCTDFGEELRSMVAPMPLPEQGADDDLENAADIFESALRPLQAMMTARVELEAELENEKRKATHLENRVSFASGYGNRSTHRSTMFSDGDSVFWEVDSQGSDGDDASEESEATKFGALLASRHFRHHSKSRALRLNNGSFGACPAVVLQEHARQREAWYVNPDLFWEKELKQGLASVGELVATEIARCKPEELAIVDNLTVAAQAICDWLVEDCKAGQGVAQLGTARSGGVTVRARQWPPVSSSPGLQFQPSNRSSQRKSQHVKEDPTNSSNHVASETKDKYVVLLSNFTYNAVTNALRAAQRRLRAHDITLDLVCVEVPFPVKSKDEVMAAYTRKLSELRSLPTGRLRLACLDHVTSLPSMVMPVKDLVNSCRAAGFARVFVDGAHAPGTVEDLDVPAVGADMYAANLHKWLFAPTSAAFLYAVDEVRRVLHHPIVSHDYGQGFVQECRMLGTRDYSAMMAVPMALQFAQRLGFNSGQLQRRNRTLCLNAARKLTAHWGTDLGHPEEMAGSTCMVGLPKELGSSVQAGQQLRQELLTGPLAKRASGGQYDSIVVQNAVPAAGRLWLRLSAAAYNFIEEYGVLQEAVDLLIADLVDVPSGPRKDSCVQEMESVQASLRSEGD